MEDRVGLPLRLYEADEMKNSNSGGMGGAELPVRIAYWRFLVQYSEVNILGTERMLVEAFNCAGLDADDTRRRFFKVVEEMRKCRSSYILETIIAESIKEVEITAEQYEKLFDCINKGIRRLRPERKLIGWLREN